MIDLNAITVVGLVGVTLVIAVGKIFEGVREWLKGFAHPWNPLRWVGEGMSCTMCSGWWVGFWWGIYSGAGVPAAVVHGGVVSLAAYVSDELLAIVAAASLRLVRRGVVAQPAQVPTQVIRPQIAPEDRPLTEDEAHVLADEEERHADDSA